MPSITLPAGSRNSKTHCLNLGCGNRYDPSWTNVDLSSRDGSVIGYDLRNGIPFADETFDVVYHSHLLEHFPKSQALPFLQECDRVLRSEGIIRVVVPDLERISELYLRALTNAAQGDEKWQHNYQWMVLELYDQTVRERPGGEMAEYLRQESIPNLEFVLERAGVEACRIVKGAQQRPTAKAVQTSGSHPVVNFMRRLLRMVRHLSRFRELIIRLVLGSEYELLKLGRFRRSGEVHLWMYDRHSLAELLRDAGFQDAQVMGAAESRIPGWNEYHLDTEPDGTVYKPDSLYMEAVKP